jgi:hypothetical protein
MPNFLPLPPFPNGKAFLLPIEGKFFGEGSHVRAKVFTIDIFSKGPKLFTFKGDVLWAR